MSHYTGLATGRPYISMFKRSLAAVFAAAVLLIPTTPALAEGINGGTLKLAPPSQGRVDSALTVRPSGTTLSRRLEALQQRFGNAVPGVTLVVMDKDWFQQNNILNGIRSYQYPLDPAQAAVVRSLTAEYVRARSGLTFQPDSFEGLEEDVPHNEGMAIKFRYGENESAAASSEKNICLLFPHFADQSRDGYYQSLLQVNASIHGDIARAPLKNPQDYEFMKRFVDYHEIGHCYDRWYIKTITRENGPQEFLATRHKAEIFGEVFANLMLVRDGYTGFFEKQADLRLAIAALSGPISARVNDQRSTEFFMTYVYLLQEGSRNAGREVERLGASRIQAMGMEDILNLAHEITERSTFDPGDAPFAVGYLMSKSFDLSELETLRHTNPVVQRRYDIALRLKNDMEGAVRRIFDFGNRTAPVLQPGSFNFSNPSFPRLGQAALEARGRELAQGLRARMGFLLTEENLIRVYTQRKDELRADLETGGPAAKEQAMIDLGLMQMALKNAYEALPEAPARHFRVERVSWHGMLLRPAA